MKPFAEYDYNDAQAVVNKNFNRDDFAQNKAFYTGDHWQDKSGWIGPKPSENDEGSESVWTEIETGFVSQNAIKEIVNRIRDAAISQQPDWDLTVRRPLSEGQQPSATEQALIDEANAALTAFWDNKKLLSELQDALAKAIWGERVCLRLYVPQGRLLKSEQLDENGQAVTSYEVPKGTLAESFKRLHLEVIEAEQSAVEKHPDTQDSIGVYLFQEETLAAGDIKTQENAAELHYLDDLGRAVIRRVVGNQTDAEVMLPLNGQLAFYELRLPPFVTATIRSQNRLLNMALTMLARNVVLGGFLERVLLNAQLPGQWVTDPATNKKVWEASEFRVGAGTTNALAGLPIHGDPSNPGKITGYTSPSVVYRDPVSPDTFLATRDAAYETILREAVQLFVLMSGDATASGESRKQAVKDFLKSLRPVINAMNDCGRWLLETSLAMAAQFSGQPERFKDLRAVFTCNVDGDEADASDIDSAIKLKDAGLIAPTTAMARVGVDDPATEKAKVDEETPLPVAVPVAEPTVQAQGAGV